MFALLLTLANEERWLVMPEDKGALFILKQLAGIMQLTPINIMIRHGDSKPTASNTTGMKTGETNDDTLLWVSANQLIVSTGTLGTEELSDGWWPDTTPVRMNGNGEGSFKEPQPRLDPPSLHEASIDTERFHVILNDNKDSLANQLQLLSLLFSFETERKGGLLVHGALAEIHGLGVILAGHGGVGKSTAAGRLPPPWRALCDDTALVVKDTQGNYWAHPWPTWSTFMFDGRGGSWDVQHAVPLACIFFLNQASNEWVERLKPVDAACQLNASAEQVANIALRHKTSAFVREHRLRRLDSIVSLAKSIPVFQLYFGSKGAFWREIETVLERKPKVIS